MKTVYITIFYAIIGYLVVAAVSPTLSFWEEFTMVITAPFVFFFQLMPKYIFLTFLGMGDFLGDIYKANPDAQILAWFGLIIKFIGGILVLVYLFVCFIMFVEYCNRFMEWFDKRYLEQPSPEIQAIIDRRDAKAMQEREMFDSIDYETESDIFFGVISRDDANKAKVQGRAIARALRNN